MLSLTQFPLSKDRLGFTTASSMSRKHKVPATNTKRHKEPQLALPLKQYIWPSTNNNEQRSKDKNQSAAQFHGQALALGLPSDQNFVQGILFF